MPNEPADERVKYLTVTFYIPPDQAWLETMAARYTEYGYRSRSAFICDTLAEAWKLARKGGA